MKYVWWILGLAFWVTGAFMLPDGFPRYIKFFMMAVFCFLIAIALAIEELLKRKPK